MYCWDSSLVLPRYCWDSSRPDIFVSPVSVARVGGHKTRLTVSDSSLILARYYWDSIFILVRYCCDSSRPDTFVSPVRVARVGGHKTKLTVTDSSLVGSRPKIIKSHTHRDLAYCTGCARRLLLKGFEWRGMYIRGNLSGLHSKNSILAPPGAIFNSSRHTVMA